MGGIADWWEAWGLVLVGGLGIPPIWMRLLAGGKPWGATHMGGIAAGLCWWEALGSQLYGWDCWLVGSLWILPIGAGGEHGIPAIWV